MFTMKGDPEKVLKDGRYTVEEFDALLRRICLETRFKEKFPGEYYLEDSEDEIGRMMVLFTKIDKYDTIVPLLSKWMSHSDDDGNENLLHFWHNRRGR